MTGDNKSHKSCKGIELCVIEDVQCVDYNNCLNNHENLAKKQKVFRYDNHKVFTTEVKKNALSYNDDECFIMANN